ncbi:MAG TPA: DNA-3-methyladenine glycosylase 2 family protein [Tepidimicrobium sp.]|nr:DNA-3-methyladenine glycosylase 2 family protein [Tepidimicrobium sp.]
MNYFEYTEEAIKHLKKVDSKLAKEIDRIGMIKRRVEPNIFVALISSIISQQISTKAATTVRNRLIGLVGELTPENIDKASLESIQQCGMSLRKAGYIKGIAEAVISKKMDLENLHNLTDQQIKKELTSLKGVGEWTAEMLLINSLQRTDVLSYKDLGIRRGIMKLYGLAELTREDFEVYKNRYSPYGTVASLYIWEISSRAK